MLGGLENRRTIPDSLGIAGKERVGQCRVWRSPGAGGMAEEPPRWEAIPEGERDRGRSHALVSGLTWALPHSASPKKWDSLEQEVFLGLIPADSVWSQLVHPPPLGSSFSQEVFRFSRSAPVVLGIPNSPGPFPAPEVIPEHGEKKNCIFSLIHFSEV